VLLPYDDDQSQEESSCFLNCITVCRYAVPHRLFMSGFRPASLTACPPREPPPLFEQEHRNPKELTNGGRRCRLANGPFNAGSSSVVKLDSFVNDDDEAYWTSLRSPSSRLSVHTGRPLQHRRRNLRKFRCSYFIIIIINFTSRSMDYVI